MNEPVFLLCVAFALGYIGRLLSLPPLVGFLAAGFLLRGIWGIEYTPALGSIADLGVTLMLFTIGLKLKLKDLTQLPVWAGSSAHLVLTVAMFTPLLMAGAAIGLPLMAGLSWGSAAIVAFALAFSSTVFAVVVFQQKGESDAEHAKTAIGILIMQDIFAVIFLTVSKGMVPSIWAVPLVLALIFGRPLISRLLVGSGHGELLVMIGLLLPIGVYQLFELVHLKGDLGALLLGVLLASSAKADELSKLLFGFKELLLVGFFLSIGLRGDPTLDILLVCGLLVLLLPLKTGLFYLLLTRFGQAARPACFATLGLSNYSEFGLIVGALAASKGWIADEWLLVFAIALSITYVLASPANLKAERIFERWAGFLHRFEGQRPPVEAIDLHGSNLLVVGMGRLGTATYQRLEQEVPGRAIGVDFVPDIVDQHTAAERRCLHADATDLEFWQRCDLGQLRAVLLAMPNHKAHMNIVCLLKQAGFTGMIAASTAHEDEAEELREAGASAAFALYDEAGQAFAEQVWEHIGAADNEKGIR